jgi:SepF-like predicted cell division protein (DUF552 family)
MQQEAMMVIARVRPLALKDSKELAKFVSELYSVAAKNNHSIFRLGEKRIIVIPSYINAENYYGSIS